MQIVNLIQVRLNRIGTAGGRAFAPLRQAQATFEIADNSSGTVRAAVIAFAVEQGESESSLGNLQRMQDQFQNGQKFMVFDLQSLNVSYSSVYAECQSLPALKADGRYFKLDEVDARPNYK